MNSSSASTSSLIRVPLGSGSVSPGDALVECLLPHVDADEASRHTNSKPGSYGSSTSVLSSPESSPSPVLPLATHPAVVAAQTECQSLQNGNDVRVLEDDDVREAVVQVLGRDAELVFPTRSVLRYLVLFVKHLAQFVELRIEVVDDKQRFREFVITNARSLARVDGDTCQLPLLLGDASSPGWRYLCMDLVDLTQQAFGSRHVATTLVRVGGSCRLLRVFFQDERYADADLPPHLTFLG